MKNLNDCIQWVRMIKKRRPNVEDLNFLNSIEEHLIDFAELQNAKIDEEKATEEDL